MEAVQRVNVHILKEHPDNEVYFDNIIGEAYEECKKTIKNDGIIILIFKLLLC